MATTWTPDKMITAERVEIVARAVFPADTYPVVNCRSEVGREGASCRICDSRNEAWAERLAVVRRGMLDAFGHKDWP